MGTMLFYLLLLVVFIFFMERFRRSNEERNKKDRDLIEKTHVNQKETIELLKEMRDLLKSKQ